MILKLDIARNFTFINIYKFLYYAIGLIYGLLHLLYYLQLFTAIKIVYAVYFLVQ